MLKWEYAVTFEFTEAPPVTERGHVASGSLHTAASRALKAARKARPRVRPSSVVIVVQKADERN